MPVAGPLRSSVDASLMSAFDPQDHSRGFVYKPCLVWAKNKIGAGYWFRN